MRILANYIIKLIPISSLINIESKTRVNISVSFHAERKRHGGKEQGWVPWRGELWCFDTFMHLKNLIFRILNGNSVYLGMHENEEVIHRLYMSLQQLDAKGMLACYHEEATFRDPVFILKSKQEILAMWTMLCAGARDFALTFEQVQADENTGSAKLEATYQFSQTDRKVFNKISAKFRFKDGLIVEHIDTFNFWKWSQQALGLPGYFLGWSSFLQKKVQKEAGKNLERFSKRT